MSFYIIECITKDLNELNPIINFMETQGHTLIWSFKPDFKKTKIKKVTRKQFFKYKYLNNI